MNSITLRYHIVCLLAVLGNLGLLIACKSNNASGRAHSFRPGSRSDIVVGKQQWSRLAGNGWFGVVYHPEGSEVSIGVSRADDTKIIAGSSEDSILKREIMLLRRYFDSTISVQGTDRISTDAGNLPSYRLKSSDPDWRLRSLVLYQDTSGHIVNIGFYSTRSSVSPKDIQYYLNTMYRGNILHH